MTVVVSGGNVLSVGSSLSPAPRSGGISLYGPGAAATYATLYREQPNVRLVIRFLGRNVAQLGLKAFRRISDSERAPLPAGHGLAEWLKSPCSISPIPVTRHRWIRAVVEDLALYDTFLAVKMRNDVTGRLSTVRIPPTNFEPLGSSALWPEKFRVFGPSGERTFDASEVIYLAGHNPTDGRAGISPIEALRRNLAEDVAAGEYREQFWRGAARHSGIVSRPAEAPKWSRPALDRFLEDFDARTTGTGPTAGGTIVLEEGMTWTEAGVTAKDAEYLGARRLSREEVAAQYFIPPVFVGILESANFSNMREQHVSLYADTLGPWLDWLETDLEVQLVPEFADVEDVYLGFNIAEKLAGSFEEQASAMSTAVGAPWMTRDEGRARFNLPPLPDGEGTRPVVPLNVLVGGLASPRDTAPPPGTAARHAPDRGAKATLSPALRGWEAKHAEVLAGFFARQRDSVVSKLGAGHELETAFDADRWNTELATDLNALASSMAEEVGAGVAEHFGAEFDPALCANYLAENARIAAEGVNGATFEALSVAWSGAPRSGSASRPAATAKNEVSAALIAAGLVDEGDDEDLPTDPFGEDFLNPARSIFESAITVRALQIATSRATSVGQFARHEGAHQAGVRSKTWVSSGSPNSRHADMDGETVALGETFSNGARWPGDPVLGVDDTAGCLCSLDFGT